MATRKSASAIEAEQAEAREAAEHPLDAILRTEIEENAVVATGPEEGADADAADGIAAFNQDRLNQLTLIAGLAEGIVAGICAGPKGNDDPVSIAHRARSIAEALILLHNEAVDALLATS